MTSRHDSFSFLHCCSFVFVMDTRLVSSPLLRLESSLCLILDILNCTGFSGASVYRLSSQDFVTSMRGTRAGGKIFDASIVFSWSSIWQHSSPVLVTSKSGGFIERTIIAASRLISGPSARRLSSPRTSKRFIVDCTSFSGLSVCKLSSHVPGNSGRLSSLQTELYCPHSANRRDSLAIVLASPAYAELPHLYSTTPGGPPSKVLSSTILDLLCHLSHHYRPLCSSSPLWMADSYTILGVPNQLSALLYTHRHTSRMSAQLVPVSRLLCRTMPSSQSFGELVDISALLNSSRKHINWRGIGFSCWLLSLTMPCKFNLTKLYK